MNSRSAPATIQVFTTECARRSAHRGGGSTAFTLIELLTAIAILSVLLCILTPSLSRARNLARNVYCANNARSLAVAQMTWSVAHDQQITPLDDDNLGQTVLDIAEARKNCWGDLLIWGGYATKNAFACPNDTRPINEARPDKARMSYGMNYYAYAVLSPPPGWRSKALLSPGLDVANPGEKIMLLDGDYWHEVLNLDKMVEWGTISEKDLKMLRFSDSVDDAFDYLVAALSEVEQGTWDPSPRSVAGEE